MSKKYLKVSEVNGYIKRLLQTDMILSNISIEGELSNFKHHYSGHMYFNLKDKNSKLKCVMFKRDNEKLNFNPKEGSKLIATGYISIYEREGEYQFYVRHLKESGVGELYIEFEKLKEKLENEGLFDSKHKKNIPYIPNTIGVVTSATGAAIRDIINVIERRYPPCNIIVYPSLVQGKNAPKEICRGLKYLDGRQDVDTIITGRGGGSMEELFCFNSEDIARTLFNMNTPVISAVGHETDFTIADFVADLRAPTPSAAAELCVPDIYNLTNNINDIHDKLEILVKRHINHKKGEIKNLKKNIDYFSPINKLKQRQAKLENIYKSLQVSTKNNISIKANRLIKLKAKLDSLNPTSSLEKGYGLLKDKNYNIIGSIKNIDINDIIYIGLKDGNLKAIVTDLEEVPRDE